MVFAEIKRHDTPLLENAAYRPGCWAPSKELSGGIVQAQQTAYLAEQDIRERLADTNDDGTDTGDFTYAIRPRTYLIIGRLDQLTDPRGNIHQDRHRSFELYRRSLHGIEVVTFDELLARAEWHVSMAADVSYREGQ